MIAGHYFIMNQFRNRHWWIDRMGTPLNDDTRELEAIVGPNSVDVTLGPEIRSPGSAGGPVDLDDPDAIEWYRHGIVDEPYMLEPRHFVLASAAEAINCEKAGDNTHWVQMYDGRSTLGRIGLQSHMTAGFGDFGFDGSFTLEIYNCFPRPIPLRFGMRVGQVFFQQVKNPLHYRGAYDGTGHRYTPTEPALGPGRINPKQSDG